MSESWEYFCYIWKHKWYVFLAGRKLKVRLWRLVIHDYSKFSLAEFGPYKRRFFGGNAGKEDKEQDPHEFHVAWLHHVHRNPHHWEHWILPSRTDDPFEMPPHFVREMVADWMGAGRAITGKKGIKGWYSNTKDKQLLHPMTRALVENLVEQYGDF